MSSFPCLSRSFSGSGQVRFTLGERLTDRYLEFVAGRCRPNTLRAVTFDLKTFFTVVGKDPVEVTAADVFDFLADQRGDRTVIRLADRESGLSARTIARRLSSVSGLYAYLVARELHRQHRAAEWKKFLARIDREVPAGLEIHIVADNYATHKTPAIQAWLAAHPRVCMHFTPTSSSWLNQVERWFGELTTKMLRRGAHKSVRTAAKLDTSFPRQFPKLEVIFEFGCFDPGEFAEFKSGVRAGKVPPDAVDKMGEFGRPPAGTAFQEWLDGTIRYSNNWAADKVITALGYPYIDGVLREAGFQSAANPLAGQLLLAGSYRHEFLHDDWADGKDLGQLGMIGTRHYQKNTNFVGSACEVARLLASVATRQAFGGDHAGQQDCDLMMQMMKHGPGINGNGSPIRDALEQIDPGIGPISGKIGIGLAPRSGASPPGLHDCAIVERTTGHGKKLRYVMAVLGGYDSEEDPFNMMVQGLDGCIAF